MGRAGAYRFEPEIEAGEEAEMQGAVPGCSCWLWFADDHDDVEQRLGNNDWYILNLLFLVVLFGRKETCLNTLRFVHHELAPARAAVSGVEGLITYPDNSPPGQFPTAQILVLMSGFIPW